MLEEITNFDIAHPEVRQLHILVHGPVGVGKSSFISSIASALKGRMVQAALADATGGTSFTKKFNTIKFRNKDKKILPFVISDIMGLEDEETTGARTDDLVMALEGSVQKQDPFYNSSPSLNDKVHCLVSLLPGDKIGLMQTAEVQSVIRKLREIREKATALGIPQVVVMTMVDNICPEVKKDLKLIYRSKKIKEKMLECEMKLGVPMNYIYPVKNYHEEIQLRNDIDTLVLSALKGILNFANDHVEQMDD